MNEEKLIKWTEAGNRLFFSACGYLFTIEKLFFKNTEKWSLNILELNKELYHFNILDTLEEAKNEANELARKLKLI